MGHRPHAPTVRARGSLVAALAALALVGCEPVVHGYRTGALTGAMVLAIVAVTVFYVMRHVHRGSVRPLDARRSTPRARRTADRSSRPIASPR